MSESNGFLKLEELYAVGPSISVLMEGYRDANGLTSLRGTLVPAKNLNKLLAKIIEISLSLGKIIEVEIMRCQAVIEFTGKNLGLILNHYFYYTFFDFLNPF